MKRTVTILTAIFLCSRLFALEVPETEKFGAGNDRSPFALNLALDGSLLGVGGAASLCGFILQKAVVLPSSDGTVYDMNTVNAFDRWAMNPYSDSQNIAATAACAIGIASPFILYGIETGCGNFPAEELLTTGTMYLETFLFSYGIKENLKYAFQRVRPYNYFDSEKPADKLADGDWTLGFPSGHTTYSFMSAAFVTTTFAYYYPESAWKIPVGCLTFGLAAATGVMRVTGGNHFISDVLAGASIGTLCGWIVPFVHHIAAGSVQMKEFNSKGNEISLLPNGIFVKIAL